MWRHIIGAYWAIVLFLSSVLLPRRDRWYLVPLYVFVLGSALYWNHRLGHYPRVWKRWFDAHVMGHHIQVSLTRDTNSCFRKKAYPGKRFSSRAYVLNQLDPYALNTVTYLVVSLITLFGFKWLVGGFSITFEWLFFIAVSLVFILAEERLHYWIHVPSTTPTCIAESRWFQYLVVVHFLHHTGNMKCNYAVLAIWLDWCYGSLKLPPPHPFIVPPPAPRLT